MYRKGKKKGSNQKRTLQKEKRKKSTRLKKKGRKWGIKSGGSEE